jgi:hypothetical protein
MINPSRALNVQDGCCLFKLAAETRNQIYELVFSPTTEKDEEGNIELSKAPAAPSNALVGTCQQIYNESHVMFRMASYDYPAIHNFTINLPDRCQRPIVPALSQHFFDRLESFSVTWRADEHNSGKPLHLTAYISREKRRYRFRQWFVQVKIRGKSWEFLPQSNKVRDVGTIIYSHCRWTKRTMLSLYPNMHDLKGESPSQSFVPAVYKTAYPGPERKT